MEAEEISAKLCVLIGRRDLKAIKGLLGTVEDYEHIEAISKEFTDRDPVVCAIEEGDEAVVLYLIEKGFPTTLLYEPNPEKCDLWCKQGHNAEPCPALYDALSLSRDRQLTKAAQLIMEIRDGVRNPGDGLTEKHVFAKTTSKTTNQQLTYDCGDIQRSFKTSVTKSKDLIAQVGLNYLDPKNGNSLIHEVQQLGEGIVYVAASRFLPINAQNFDGDTALHLALKANDLQVTRALLSVGADVSIRNKLGQVPPDVTSNPEARTLLEMYRPGLLKALQNGNAQAMQRLINLWCCPDSNMKNGLSAMDIATELKNSSAQSQKCLKLLEAHRARLQLVHAVLAEDTNALEEILETGGGRQMINTRYGGRSGGATVLSRAIEQGSLDVLKILMATGKCNLSLRVTECMEKTKSPTMPLYFKTLSRDSPTEVWQYVSKYVELTEDFEKDKDGNTPLLRAIQNGKSLEFMTAFFRGLNFNRLLLRNQRGQTARELASELGRTDIVQLIDKKILSVCGQGLYPLFPATFHNQSNVATMMNNDGRSIFDITNDSDNDVDKSALRHWTAIENLGLKLFQEASEGNSSNIDKLNTTDYTDRNGFTALTRAVVFNQPQIAQELLIHRPELRMIGDNLNRYPLHFAYGLPEEQSQRMVAVILSNAQQGIEHRRDKDGREPAEYAALRDTQMVLEMLHDARTLDAYGKRVDALGPLPEGARVPPFADIGGP